MVSASRLRVSPWVPEPSAAGLWGGTDEEESIRMLHAALNHGINVIDTAPVYGFGRSEEIVGKAVARYGGRDKVIIATKAALEWREGGGFPQLHPGRITAEVEDSLRRLQPDYIDLYQVHWPDPLVPVYETATVMAKLHKEGKIRAIGVSNYSPAQMEVFRQAAPLH